MNFQGLFAGGAAFSPFLLEQRSKMDKIHIINIISIIKYYQYYF